MAVKDAGDSQAFYDEVFGGKLSKASKPKSSSVFKTVARPAPDKPVTIRREALSMFACL